MKIKKKFFKDYIQLTSFVAILKEYQDYCDRPDITLNDVIEKIDKDILIYQNVLKKNEQIFLKELEEKFVQ